MVCNEVIKNSFVIVIANADHSFTGNKYVHFSNINIRCRKIENIIMWDARDHNGDSTPDSSSAGKWIQIGDLVFSFKF